MQRNAFVAACRLIHERALEDLLDCSYKTAFVTCCICLPPKTAHESSTGCCRLVLRNEVARLSAGAIRGRQHGRWAVQERRPRLAVHARPLRRRRRCRRGGDRVDVLAHRGARRPRHLQGSTSAWLRWASAQRLIRTRSAVHQSASSVLLASPSRSCISVAGVVITCCGL